MQRYVIATGEDFPSAIALARGNIYVGTRACTTSLPSSPIGCITILSAPSAVSVAALYALRGISR